MPHVKPLDPSELPEDIRDHFEHYRKTRGFTPNSIQTMAHRPDIVRAFMQLNQSILYEGTVCEELKMLVSLIASQAAGCRYCQAHMANLASIHHASREKIAAVWEFETSGIFTDAERAALRLAFYGAMSPGQTKQEHFDELGRYYDEEQIVEIVAAVALFGFLNRWNDAMATELEEVPALVAANLLAERFGWERGKHGG